jgi:microcystin-dependent protein
MAWPSATVPSGWLECNGQSTSGYTALASVVGATVPDLRGEFIRGWDHGKGTDSGRTLLSSQADELKSHTHSITTRTSLAPQSGSDTPCWARDSAGTTGATGGSETRPRNIALMYIIKT